MATLRKVAAAAIATAGIAGTITIMSISVPSGTAAPATIMSTNQVEEIDELLKPYEPRPTKRSVLLARKTRAPLSAVLADSVDTRRTNRKAKNKYNDEIYFVVKKADKKAFVKAFKDSYCAPLALKSLRGLYRQCRQDQDGILTNPACDKKTKAGVVIGWTTTMRVNKRMFDTFVGALPAGTVFTDRVNRNAAETAAGFKACYDKDENGV